MGHHFSFAGMLDTVPGSENTAGSYERSVVPGPEES